MKEDWDYEFRNINMDKEVNEEKVTLEDILIAIEKIEYGRAWGCLFPNGSCILIQKGRSRHVNRIKYLKCSSSGVANLIVFSNKDELIKTLKHEVFNWASNSVVHYEFVSIIDITEVYEDLMEGMNLAFNKNLLMLRSCWKESL